MAMKRQAVEHTLWAHGHSLYDTCTCGTDTMTESVAESARVRLPFESGSVCPVTTETAPLALNFLCQLARHKSPLLRSRLRGACAVCNYTERTFGRKVRRARTCGPRVSPRIPSHGRHERRRLRLRRLR